jgi:lysine-specific demethylase/histidyl-hydroxylase NO66
VGDAAEFRRDVVFRRPALSRVSHLARFGDVETLWHDLLRRGARQPAFRLVRSGSTVAAREVTRRAGIGNQNLSDLVSANRVIDRYRCGDTVVLQGLHHTNPHLARLSNNIALALDHPVQINAYLSPASARGLDVHFDFHDVFIVQLAGSKRWRVWAPLPRTTDPVKGRHAIAKPQMEELGEPLLDLTLNRGDCLYLPRGYPHAAETLDEASDHLTIGLVAVTWERVLHRAIDAEVAAGRLTAALPIGSLDSATALSAGVDVAMLRAQLAPGVLRHWMAREIWRRQPATRLRPLVAPPVGSPMVSFTPGPLVWLTTAGDRSVLGLGDRVLDMPEEAHDFLSTLLATEGPVSTDLVGGLDEASRAVVVGRLLAEGVLTHVHD